MMINETFCDHRTLYRINFLGLLFLVVCMIAGCAAYDEELGEGSIYYPTPAGSSIASNKDKKAQSGDAATSESTGGGMGGGRGMAPNFSMVEQMRASRMAHLDQSPGAGDGSGVFTGTGRQKTEPAESRSKKNRKDNSLLQAGIESYNLGDYDGAVKTLKKFVDNYPSSDATPEALFFLGETYFRVKNYNKAITSYKQVDRDFSRYPRAGEALYKVGMCLKALGNAKLSKRVFKKVAAKYPSFDPKKIKD